MIHQKKLFKEVFFTSIIIAVLHYIATIYSFYWSIEWFDILMHFIGGLLMGLIAFWIFFTSEKVNYPKDNLLVIFFTVIGFALVIGLSWELWELFEGFSDVNIHKKDTILDVVMDTIGAICAFYYGLLKTNFFKD